MHNTRCNTGLKCNMHCQNAVLMTQCILEDVKKLEFRIQYSAFMQSLDYKAGERNMF